MMKFRISYGLLATCTFLLGLLPALVLSPEKQIQVNIKGLAEIESPLFNNEPVPKRNGRYPDPLYSFPKRGTYFSTSTQGGSNSIFQFELPLEFGRKQGYIPKYKSALGFRGQLHDASISFDRVDIDIAARTIVLRSRTLGYEYIFSGEFLDKGYLESEYFQQVVLTGTLEERVLGQKVRKQYFEFWYGVGC